MTQIKNRTNRWAELELDDERTIQLSYQDPYGYDPEHLVTELPDGRIVVSYMVSDSDRWDLDPSKEDCLGWQGFRILDSQSDADRLSELLNDCEYCGYSYDHHLMADGTPRTDLEEYLDCTGYTRPPAARAIDAGRAFLFEKYEHGMVRYALRGESSMVDRQWDVSPVAGFMWADDDWGDDVNIEQAARSFLQTYTDWCNGNVWGVIHETFDADLNQLTEESCWGYIGDEFAEQIMKEEHEWHTQH